MCCPESEIQQSVLATLFKHGLPNLQARISNLQAYNGPWVKPFQRNYGDPPEIIYRSRRAFQSHSVTGTDTDRSATYDFLLVIIVTTGLPRTVSEIKSDIVKFSHPVERLPSIL